MARGHIIQDIGANDGGSIKSQHRGDRGVAGDDGTVQARGENEVHGVLGEIEIPLFNGPFLQQAPLDRIGLQLHRPSELHVPERGAGDNCEQAAGKKSGSSLGEPGALGDDGHVLHGPQVKDRALRIESRGQGDVENPNGPNLRALAKSHQLGSRAPGVIEDYIKHAAFWLERNDLDQGIRFQADRSLDLADHLHEMGLPIDQGLEGLGVDDDRGLVGRSLSKACAVQGGNSDDVLWIVSTPQVAG